MKDRRRDAPAKDGHRPVRVSGRQSCRRLRGSIPRRAAVFHNSLGKGGLMATVLDAESVAARAEDNPATESDALVVWAAQVTELGKKIDKLGEVLDNPEVPFTVSSWSAQTMGLSDQFIVDAFKLGVRAIRDKALSELRELRNS